MTPRAVTRVTISASPTGRGSRSPDERSSGYAADLRLDANYCREVDHFRYVLPGLSGVAEVAWVSEKMFSREQYEQLRSFPEISRDELFRYFTLTPADVAFVDPGAGRGAADRLGMAVLGSALPWLGFVPDDVASAAPVAVARLAERLGLDPGSLWAYGQRAQDRS